MFVFLLKKKKGNSPPKKTEPKENFFLQEDVLMASVTPSYFK
jgi:hypothetical protein